jgi:hypothetical protein
MLKQIQDDKNLLTTILPSYNVTLSLFRGLIIKTVINLSALNTENFLRKNSYYTQILQT